MYVVVVGSREWAGDWAHLQVTQLLEELRQKYSGLVVISSSCDQGVGYIVKQYCLKDRVTFQLIEFYAKVFAKLPRSKLAQVFYARNRALAAIGEEFHIFVDESRRGAMEDLVDVVKAENRPHTVHMPNRTLKASPTT